MPDLRRNNRADALSVQESPPPWGPPEIRALWDELRRADAEGRGRPESAWDLLVIGAGITGAGVARDAAMRGLRVLVLEAKDLAFGTSSRSSRLIHGGVRYLEQGELGLVYEALRERRLLYKIAGHIVQPARFLFPAYRGDRLPLWKLRLGLSLYDALSLYRSRGHRMLSPAAARQLEPLLRAEDLRGAVTYEDAVTDDARLTLATLQDADLPTAVRAMIHGMLEAELLQPKLHRVILEEVPRVALRKRLDIERLVAGHIPRLAAAIQHHLETPD